MGFPTVRCGICAQEVSKRSTIQVPLDGKPYRICRTHQEAKDHVAKVIEQHAEQKMKDAIRKGSENLLVIAAASAVHVQCTINGMLPSVAMFLIKSRIPKHLIPRLEEEIVKRGGFIMSSKEIEDSLFAYACLRQRAG